MSLIKEIQILPLKEKKEEGEIVYSASQIKMYRACNICWAVKYLSGIEREANISAMRGKEIHSILEDYLTSGKPFDPNNKYTKMILPAVKYLPNPGIAKVEEGFRFGLCGHLFNGFIDFYYKKESSLILGDHKTTKNFRYMPAPEALINDPQTNLYALYLMAKEGLDKVNLNWIYYKTEGAPESKILDLEINLTKVEENVTLILEDCEVMTAARKEQKTPYDFKAPISGCKWYGGCMIKDYILEKEKPMTTRNIYDILKKKQIEEITSTEVKQENSAPIEQMEEINVEKIEFDHSEDVNENNFTLMIDCFPTKGAAEVIPLTKFLTPVKKKINELFKVEHYKFIQYYSAGAFNSMLIKYLEMHPLKNNEILTLDSGSMEGRDSLEILSRYAKIVIRGTKA